MLALPSELAFALPTLYDAHLDHLERGVAAALHATGFDAVALHAGALVSKTHFDDQAWPFRPLPPFAHVLPLVEPDAVVVLGDSQKPHLLRVANRNFWERPQPPEAWSEYWTGRFATTVVDDVAALGRALRPGPRTALIAEDATQAARLGFAPEQLNPPALVAALDKLRVLKTPYEIACLAEANRRAALGHRAVGEAFRAGAEASELELHLAFLRATAQDDAETPYKNIVALGENAATLHHVHYGRRPSSRAVESLLVDAAATFQGYASDITRTHLRGPSDSATLAAFGRLLAGMETLQRELCAGVEIGMPYEQLHDRSHALLGKLLAEVGVVRGSADEAVASGLTRAFYPHGLGHSLGLCTHDVGCADMKPRADNPFLRNTSRIAAGQVFTIEPGVYFIEMLLAPLRDTPTGRLVDWALVEALKPLGGIRIEDDVHVRAGAPLENLTRAVLPS